MNQKLIKNEQDFFNLITNFQTEISTLKHQNIDLLSKLTASEAIIPK